MCGRMGEAIALTNRLYPLFLQKNPSLHFMLKVRQFIEMVAGEQRRSTHPRTALLTWTRISLKPSKFADKMRPLFKFEYLCNGLR